MTGVSSQVEQYDDALKQVLYLSFAKSRNKLSFQEAALSGDRLGLNRNLQKMKGILIYSLKHNRLC